MFSGSAHSRISSATISTTSPISSSRNTRGEASVGSPLSRPDAGFADEYYLCVQIKLCQLEIEFLAHTLVLAERSQTMMVVQCLGEGDGKLVRRLRSGGRHSTLAHPGRDDTIMPMAHRSYRPH